MARRPRVSEFTNWTGGLNYTGDAFTLAENEVVDCLNVTLLPRGGFQRRKTASYVNATVFSDARNLWAYYGGSDPQLMVQDGNDLLFSTDGGATFSAALSGGATVAGRMRAAVAARNNPDGTNVTTAVLGRERCYVQRNGEASAVRWDGETLTSLGDAHGNYNSSFDAPNGLNMPRAKYICAHAGFMFHGYTYEGDASYPTRIRWSHPNEPEDYRMDDWADVGGDGEPIVGLASFGPALYVFKRRSVWVLSGYDNDTFQLARLSDTAGAVSQEAIVASPQALFFFDSHDGVFAIAQDGSFRWLWSNLSVKINDGSVNSEAIGQATCGWMDQRLWVSVPWDESTVNKRMFVFDPLLGQGGAWYQHAFGNYVERDPFICSGKTFGISAMNEFRPSNSQIRYFGLGSGGVRLFQLESDDDYYDKAGPDDNRAFSSALQTAWYRVGVAGAQKRFRRPRFVLTAANSATVNAVVYRDYEPSFSPREMALTVNVAASGLVWGQGNWGDENWSGDESRDQTVVRGRALGSAYAVSFLFSGQREVVWDGNEAVWGAPTLWGAPTYWSASYDGVPPWGVNAIDLIYLPKAVR